MATTIDFRELVSRFLELVTRVDAGDEVIVTDGETPRAIFRPQPSSRPRSPGLHPGAMQTAPDFDAPLPEEFWMGGDAG